MKIRTLVCLKNKINGEPAFTGAVYVEYNWIIQNPSIKNTFQNGVKKHDWAIKTCFLLRKTIKTYAFIKTYGYIYCNLKNKLWWWIIGWDF